MPSILSRAFLGGLTAFLLPCLALAHEGADGEHSHAHASTVMTTRTDAQVIPPLKAEDVFHFIVYGDRTGGVPAGLKVLEQAVEDSNLLDPDLVMTVGDLIQGYNQEPEWLEQMAEYQEIMNRLKMRWFPVAGNHDVYWRGQGAAPAGQHEANYEKHFGPLWYSFSHKNAGFIVLFSDEGDAATNRKGFSEAALQMMSDAQLEFLDKALKELSGQDHVFVFLHHPRWIGGGYTGSNWNLVHQKLVAAGNVSAVFAGHIHHMRYDGPTDGIEYYTLATTGGNLSGDIPDAGYLHHLNMVTVRQDRISVSALPIGAVIDPRDFTPEFLAEVAQARSIRPIAKSDATVLQADGSSTGEVTYTLTNPCPREADVTLMFDTGNKSTYWMSTLDHEHFTLAPKETREVTFSLHRQAGNTEHFAIPAVRMELEYISQTARVRLPAVIAPIELQLGEVPADYFANSTPHCLLVENEQGAVRIASDDIKMEDGPMTLEAWVQPTQLAGFSGLIAKTQSSEYAIFCDEGVPQFDLHVGGRYVSAKAKDVLSLDQWTHVAGQFDGSSLKLFINGKEVANVAAEGKRRFNDLPLFIGADPNQSGTPTRAFQGKIDEVRLSKAALYSGDFTPETVVTPSEDTVLLMHLDKQLGPFTLDHSNSAAEATLGRTSKLVPVDR
ncbi:LamG-like jellyroll fold domain-containing protein [Aureliella helgolandensis]|uniref:Calcineurin-like phosphoesterase n=1 Tax=Aureliella helgolandensis TaxID=2527968 RepID=A0A518FZN0_9BACT|nr:LamG-like jellyroll fold domain-containing protein [Aureliella helgolandensis]QDV21818.1 Calcineurin-like phosphoesterase [Aureliella helgolandensis]